MVTLTGPTSADHKVAGGKLLRVRMNIQEGKLAAITITGDFFMHPEEAIEMLEHMLLGCPLNEDAVRAGVEAFFATDVQVIGAGADDFVHVILSAAQG